ncbi:MAG: GIY-YIG nuclease family protein [Microgenomates group bacterium]
MTKGLYDDFLYLKNKTGIYVYTNIINNKKYIGQALNLYKRITIHEKNFENKKCPNTENIPLWGAIKKYGRNFFKLEILEYIENDNNKLDERETFYILRECSTVDKWGYNILIKGFSRTGVNHTQNTKNKISKWGRKRKKSKEHSSRISSGRMGIKTTSSKSKYVGVSEKKYTNKIKESYSKWQAGIFINKKSKYIGIFSTEIMAAEARDDYIIKNNLDIKLNFPERRNKKQ